MRTLTRRAGPGLALALICTCCGPAGDAPPAEPEQLDVLAGKVSPELIDRVESDPGDAAARLELATELRAAGHLEDALPQFEKLVEIDPSADHLIELAKAYTSLGRLPDAATTYQRVLRTEPRHAVALYSLGGIALARNEVGMAVDLYRRAVEADPAYLVAHHDLGHALALAGQFREAYRSFEKVLDLEPSSPTELAAFDDAVYRLALLDLQMGATERAVKFLEFLLESVPDHPEAHLAYSQALTKLGRDEDAKRELETHLRLAAERTPG